MGGVTLKIISKTLYDRCVIVGEGGTFRTNSYIYKVTRLENGYVHCIRINAGTYEYTLAEITYYKYYRVTAVGWSLYEDYDYRFEQIERIEAWQEIHSYIREYRDKRYIGCKILSVDEIATGK